jgi:hypothetical protein
MSEQKPKGVTEVRPGLYVADKSTSVFADPQPPAPPYAELVRQMNNVALWLLEMELPNEQADQCGHLAVSQLLINAAAALEAASLPPTGREQDVLALARQNVLAGAPPVSAAQEKVATALILAYQAANEACSHEPVAPDELRALRDAAKEAIERWKPHV